MVHAAIQASRSASFPPESACGRLLEEISGGNRMTAGGSLVLSSEFVRSASGRAPSSVPFLLAKFGPPLLRGLSQILQDLGPLFYRDRSLQFWVEDSYLVDSASSHMLVSKIKPCMSKYKQSIL